MNGLCERNLSGDPEYSQNALTNMNNYRIFALLSIPLFLDNYIPASYRRRRHSGSPGSTGQPEVLKVLYVGPLRCQYDNRTLRSSVFVQVNGTYIPPIPSYFGSGS